MATQSPSSMNALALGASAARNALDRVSLGQAWTVSLRWAEYFMIVIVLWATAGAFHGLIIKAMGGAPFLGVFSFTPHVAALFVLAFRPVRTLKGLIAVWPAFPFLGLCMASYFWSANPGDTFNAALECAAAVVVAGYLTRRFGWLMTMQLVFAAFVSMLVCSLLIALAMPGVGATSAAHPGAWSGLFMEKNKFGGICVLGFAATCAHYMSSQRRPVFHVAIAIMCVALLLLSQSKTALLSFIVTSGAFGFMLVVRRGPVSGLLGSYLGVIVVGVASFLVATNVSTLLELLGRSGDLSSRADIWRSMAELAAAKPWGYGYDAFWTDEGMSADVAWIEKWLNFRPSHGHNSWLDARLELGVLGPIVLGVLVGVALVFGGLRPRGDRRVYWAVPFIAYIMVTSMSETIIMGPSNTEWLLLLLTGALVSPMPRGWRAWENAAPPQRESGSIGEVAPWSGGRTGPRSAAARGWPHPRPASSRYPRPYRPGRGPSRG